jgi:hypothetical protein
MVFRLFFLKLISKPWNRHPYACSVAHGDARPTGFELASSISAHNIQIDPAQYGARLPPLFFGPRRSDDLFFRSTHQLQRVC